MKFVPAVARLFYLALPACFLTTFAQNKGDLCICVSCTKTLQRQTIASFRALQTFRISFRCRRQYAASLPLISATLLVVFTVHCYCSCTFESLVNGTTPMGVCSMQHTSQGDKSYRSSVTLPGYFCSFKCKMANRQMIQVSHKKTESAFSLIAGRNPMIHPIHNEKPSKIFHRVFVSTASQHCFPL